MNEDAPAPITESNESLHENFRRDSFESRFNSNLNSDHNPYIDYLKGIAAFFVVLGHSITYLHNYVDNVSVLGQIVGNVVSAVHVPLFILISGYLCHKQAKRKYLVKKIYRIIIPFFFFSFLKFVCDTIEMKDSLTIRSLLIEIYDIFLIGSSYWFVYCIFIIYLIAILFWDKKTSKFILPCALFLILFNSFLALMNVKLFPEKIVFGELVLEKPLFQVERTIQYLPYFLLGMYLQNCGVILEILDKYRNIIGVVSLIIISVCVYIVVGGISNKNYYIKFIMAITEMIALRYIVKNMKYESSSLKLMGLYSFQIMLFDGFYRIPLFAVISRIICPNFPISIAISITVVTLSVISCFMAKRNRQLSLLVGV